MSCYQPNQLPVVELTAPFEGETFDSLSNIHLTAFANDSDGTISSVSFYQNDVLLFEDVDFPYEFYWENVVEGDYVIVAKARDNAGAAGVSDVVNIQIKASPKNETNPDTEL